MASKNASFVFSRTASHAVVHGLLLTAEIVAAAMAYFKLQQKPVNKEDVSTIFNAFMARIASPSRPIYFHTDDSRLRQIFVALKKAGVNPEPSRFPFK